MKVALHMQEPFFLHTHPPHTPCSFYATTRVNLLLNQFSLVLKVLYLLVDNYLLFLEGLLLELKRIFWWLLFLCRSPFDLVSETH